jgi:glycosyltransferase involved in cell wall biosynthesis
MLPRCLKSIVKLCDEIIVVDTGSSDNSIEIAKSFGAEVITCKWQNSFSYHRNQAFEYASGDWYLIMDADEELVSDKINPELFKDRLASVHPSIACLLVTTTETIKGVETFWPGFRFLRASANPKYRKNVHNKLTYEGYAAETDIILKHYGYSLSPEKMAMKRERTRGLLNKRLEENPDDFNAMYYMCQLAMGQKDWQDAVDWGNKCRDLLPFTNKDDLQYYSVLYYWMGMAHLGLNDGNWAAAWIEKGLAYFPDDIDINYARVTLGYMADNKTWIDEAAQRYFNAIAEKNNGKNHSEFCNLIERSDVVQKMVYCSGADRQKTVRDILEEMA